MEKAGWFRGTSGFHGMGSTLFFPLAHAGKLGEIMDGEKIPLNRNDFYVKWQRGEDGLKVCKL